MPLVTAPSNAPTIVTSRPENCQERIEIMDLAAPTAKWATSEITAAAVTASTFRRKKKGDEDADSDGGGERVGTARGERVCGTNRDYSPET